MTGFTLNLLLLLLYVVLRPSWALASNVCDILRPFVSFVSKRLSSLLNNMTDNARLMHPTQTDSDWVSSLVCNGKCLFDLNPWHQYYQLQYCRISRIRNALSAYSVFPFIMLPKNVSLKQRLQCFNGMFLVCVTVSHILDCWWVCVNSWLLISLCKFWYFYFTTQNLIDLFPTCFPYSIYSFHFASNFF